MVRTSGRVLKSEHVELEGVYYLDGAQAASSGTEPPQGHPAVTAAGVRILENHREYALVEVTCPCGRKMALRCGYAGAQAPANPQMQNGTTAVPSEKE
jgi:hypothetical protein